MSSQDRFFFGAMLGCLVVIMCFTIACYGQLVELNEKIATPVVTEEAR